MTQQSDSIISLFQISGHVRKQTTQKHHVVQTFYACYVYDGEIFDEISIASLDKCYISEIFVIKNEVLPVCVVRYINDQGYVVSNVC